MSYKYVIVVAVVLGCTSSRSADAQHYYSSEVQKAEQKGPHQQLTQAANPTQQPGVFVAPPQSGNVQGPVNQLGIAGAELALPAIRLRTPTLRLPAFFRSRTNAQMNLNADVAPFVSGQAQTGGIPVAVQALQMGMVSGAAVNGVDPRLTAQMPPEQLGALARQLDQQRDAVEKRTSSLHEATDQKLQEIEEREQQFQRRIEQLQKCLDKLLENQQALMDAEMRRNGLKWHDGRVANTGYQQELHEARLAPHRLPIVTEAVPTRPLPSVR